jgi:hypothetical protein
MMGATPQEDRFLIVIFVFVSACLGIAAFSVAIIINRYAKITPGREITGWRAVCLGIFLLLFGPLLLLGIVILLTLVPYWLAGPQ